MVRRSERGSVSGREMERKELESESKIDRQIDRGAKPEKQWVSNSRKKQNKEHLRKMEMQTHWRLMG